MEKRDFLKTGLLAFGALLIPRKSQALEYYPNTKTPEWAILYGTWCGSSRDAGVWISEGMNGIANVFDARENPDLSGYKYIIVGGSIRANVTPNELQQYLTAHKADLAPKIKGYFAVCGNMKQPVTPDLTQKFIDNHLAQITGVKDIPSKVFLGRITMGLLEPEVQNRMRSGPRMEDYDNLKRSECMAFGQEILNSLKQNI